MMSMQAHEICTPYKNDNQVLRAYAENSPRAKARLLALSMLVDGHLDDAELANLSKEGTLAKLGVSREVFNEVLFDFCNEVRSLPSDSSSYLLTPAVLGQLFGEVICAAERKELLRLIFDMIRSDGHLADSECELFWHAIDLWKFQADDTHMALHGRRMHSKAGKPKLEMRTK